MDIRLFFVTGNGRRQFAPQVADICTVVNFTCAGNGLNDAGD